MVIGLLIIAGMLTLNILFYIGQIGKPRKPIKPSYAVTVTMVNAAFVVVIVLAAVHILH